MGKDINSTMIDEDFLSEKDKTSKVFEVGKNFGLEFKNQQQFEFFFYATNENSASNLLIDLYRLQYEVEPIRKLNAKEEWLVNGWTCKMNSDELTVGEWSAQMGELARLHDAKFDGWGSFVDKKGGEE